MATDVALALRLSAFRGELPTSLFRPPWPLCLSFHSWFGRVSTRVCLLLAMNRNDRRAGA